MREDFRRLTPEALAALANWGLVKRAQREPFPQLTEGVDGLTAVFPDGTECFFASTQPAALGRCSCGAAGWCRHRIGAILACADADNSDSAEEFVAIDLAQVEKLLGRLLWNKALAQKKRGLTLEVLGPPWQVRLPGCTVRFLLGAEAGYCKCDCELNGACEHWALAAWAVNERAGQPGTLVWHGQARQTGLRQTREWLEELLQVGVLGSSALWQVWRGRVNAEIAGCSWLRVLVEEIEELSLAHAQAATHYSPSSWLFCLLSLVLRLSDGSAHLLGREVVWEQELEHSRLSCLGCRKHSQGVQIYWADAVGQVLVQRLQAGVESTPALGRLSEVARSQVVSRGLVRRADGSLRFRRERSRHSLTRLGLDWRDLPPALVWPGRESWAQQWNERPTRLLQPPVLGKNLWVVPLSWASEGNYDPGAQQLLAVVGDQHGGQLQIRRTHQKECPGALDALAWALAQSAWLTGFVSLEGASPVLEPISLVTGEEVIVLDLHQGAEAFQWPVGLGQPQADPLAGLLQEALELCQQAAHLGLAQLLPSFQRRRQELAQQLGESAMMNLGRALSDDWNFWGAALRCFLAAERSTPCGI
jgi:hypothetical protein